MNEDVVAQWPFMGKGQTRALFWTELAAAWCQMLHQVTHPNRCQVTRGRLHHHKDNVWTNQIWRVGLVWVINLKSLVTQNGVSCSPDKTMQCILRVISKVNLFWSHLYPIQSVYIALCWSKYGISNVTGQNMQDLMPPFPRPGIRAVTMICPLPAMDTTTPARC